jgi:hypothetical protein
VQEEEALRFRLDEQGEVVALAVAIVVRMWAVVVEGFRAGSSELRSAA